MAVDPRYNFTIKTCDRSSVAQQAQQEQKKGFFDNLKANTAAVAGIEAFQGPVADGLRSLVGVSESIRTGDTSSAIIRNGAAPGTDGANIVLSTVGIEPGKAIEAAAFNPGVVNRGTAEARSIYDRVEQGNFELNDIPNSFQSLQNLSTLTAGIFNDGTAPATSPIERCGAVPYATALIRYTPKYKFLFIVQFTFKEKYIHFNNNKIADQMAFVVKNGGRPNINIEHEEVNLYNFHTRVAKRTVYEPITMRFLDDKKGNTHYLLNHYIRTLSPVSRLPSSVNGNTALNNHQDFEQIGMVPFGRSSASLTKLKGNVTSIFDEIRVYHLYDDGRKMTTYSYANPKLTSINFDDLDMADNGNGSEIEIQFAYDRLHITDEMNVQKNQELLEEISGTAIGEQVLQIKPVFDSTTDQDKGGADSFDPEPADEQETVGPNEIVVGSNPDTSTWGPDGTLFTETRIDADGNSSSFTYYPD